MSVNILDFVKIVLCDTSHAGNIGSTARAMKTMGITQLILVSPKINTDDEHAFALACNARDVLEFAITVDNLDEAIADCTLAIGLTSRKREFNSLLHTPKEIIPQILSSIKQQQSIALVFGSEKFGLSIEQLEKCNCLVTILGNPEYFSLNLSQAVQIMCYEIYSNINIKNAELYTVENMATINDNLGVNHHLDTILNKINYYKNKNIIRTQRRLNHIIHKAQLNREDVDLLRGILKKIEQNIS